MEDGVEIGCNSVVDCFVVGEICIGKNIKFDNMVYVVYGCCIGEVCVLVG